MIDLDLFFRYLKGRCHGNQFYAKNGKLPIFVALAFRNGMGYRYLNVRVNSGNDACILCAKFCDIRSSNSRVDRAHLRTSGMTLPKNGPIWSNISGSTGPIFAIFAPYERALRADDGSVAFFPIYQGTLP